MVLLRDRLDKKWADEVIHEEVGLILAVINDLHEKGLELSRELDGGEYATKEEFYKEHDKGNSALCRLEGRSTRKDDIFILKACPMMDLLEAASKDGRLPEYFDRIVDKWKSVYKRKGAVLHPYCIVHQVIRSSVGEKIKIGNRGAHIYQIACRSPKSGRIAFAEEGVAKHRLEHEDVSRMIDGNSCMYSVG